MRVRIIECGRPVNKSERRAIDYLKSSLSAETADGEWILLTNLHFSSRNNQQSAEIDIIAVGPPGAKVIEVKHWSSDWIRNNRRTVEKEAEKVTDKAKKIGSHLRKTVQAVGRVEGAILVTETPKRTKGLAREPVRNIHLFSLKQWKHAIGFDLPNKLSSKQVPALAKTLEPLAPLYLHGRVKKISEYSHLDLKTPEDEAFHRVYHGIRENTNERIWLHLYDLTSESNHAHVRAKREFEALQRLYKSKWTPQVLQSFREMPTYPGEMYFYVLKDPGAQTLHKRTLDDLWTTASRLRFALSTIQAVRDLHSTPEGQDPILHRNITPETILVNDDNLPILTGFELTRLPENQTISTIPPRTGQWQITIAPEVARSGLQVADTKSDSYSLCKSLQIMFEGRDDKLSKSILECLAIGSSDPVNSRWNLAEVAEYLSSFLDGEEPSQRPQPEETLDLGSVVTFREKSYRIVGHLGQGGVGAAFKVEHIDRRSEDVYGLFVGKTVKDPQHGTNVLRNYQLARPHLGSHPALSTIYEVADGWLANQFVAILKWVDGFALRSLIDDAQHSLESDFLGELEYDFLGEGEVGVLNCLKTLCEALEVFHSNNLVHGDVSPGNIILSNGSPVLTDYDLVAKVGETPLSQGTLTYCSPLRQQNQPATPADDLFALAATFFHVLFGTEPFAGTSSTAKQNGLRWTDVDGQRWPKVAAFLRKATDPVVTERFRDASEASAALSVGVSSVVPSTTNRIKRPKSDADQPTLTETNALEYNKSRSRLVKWLRSQLMGPLPDSKTLVGISPVDRFPTGVLYPVESPGRHVSLIPDQTSASDTGIQLEDEHEDNSDDPMDIQASNPGLPTPRRHYVLPSSVGFSFFMTGHIHLQVQASAATYQIISDRDPEGKFQSLEYEQSNLSQSVEWKDGALTSDSGDGRLQISIRQRKLPEGSMMTVTLSNNQPLIYDNGANRSKALAELSIFNVDLECCIHSGTLQTYPRVDMSLLSDEEREIEIQYRHKAIYAVGHGGSVNWCIESDIPRIWTEFLPTVEVPRMTTSAHPKDQLSLDLGRLAKHPVKVIIPHLEKFIQGYGDWIDSQTISGLPKAVQPDIARIRQRMTDAHVRMRDGVALIAADSLVARAFQIANLAMLDQMKQGDLVSGKDASGYSWRPFQLAFLLTVIKSAVDDDDSFKDVVDLIWFPTGGGKTEAYLGLVVFLIAWRRLKYGSAGTGTVALMRYTMRLLTSQQFERAARVIFALELIRRSTPDCLGSDPITVGLWVGSASSPNRFDDAIECVRRIETGDDVPGRLILASCPWCRTSFTRENYLATTDAFAFVCQCVNCEFGQTRDRLPCNVVDEALYHSPPALLIGTIDKFARLAWNGRASSFFGSEPIRPPELVIQDELHLVTGPLGSVAGLYEAGLDVLLRSRGTRPKYIASSATVHMAATLVKRLYGRSVRVFPPPGLSCDDCYFARTDPSRPGRLYVGYLTPVLDKHHCLAPMAAALLAAPLCVFGDESERAELIEAWWTQIVYHTSLRSVGSSHTSYEVSVRDWEKRLLDEHDEVQTFGGNMGTQGPSAYEGGRYPPRWRRAENLHIDQLTSVKTARENARTFAKLAKRHDEHGSLDVVLATNMVSVGLDVGRLALMIINGQPLTTAEYIQASSRVGRADVPGIVIANYHRSQASSLFHYENFRPYHESFYRFVEASSVTPFTYQVRLRALHAALVIAIRHACPELRDNQDAILFDPSSDQVRRIIETLKARCRDAGSAGGGDHTGAHIDSLVVEWRDEVERCKQNRRSLKYDSDRDRASESLLVRFGSQGVGLWRTLDSMRDVEKTAVLKEIQKAK